MTNVFEVHAAQLLRAITQQIAERTVDLLEVARYFQHRHTNSGMLKGVVKSLLAFAQGALQNNFCADLKTDAKFMRVGGFEDAIIGARLQPCYPIVLLTPGRKQNY